MTDDVKCPICGSGTILRTAKKGPEAGKKFYVCVNHPKCKGRIPLTETVSATQAETAKTTIQKPRQKEEIAVYPQRALGSFFVFVGYFVAIVLGIACFVVGILTLFVSNLDGTPITGIPNHLIGIPMVLCCPVAGLPGWLLILLGSALKGDEKVRSTEHISKPARIKEEELPPPAPEFQDTMEVWNELNYAICPICNSPMICKSAEGYNRYMRCSKSNCLGEITITNRKKFVKGKITI